MFKVGLANLSDLAFSFDGFKLLADRASRKNILVKGVSSARLPVEGSGIKIREGKASTTTLKGPIETSYRNIKAFLPFTGSTKFVFRTLIFVLALVLYSLYTIFKGEVGREEFRLLLILLFPDLFNLENFTFNVIEALIYTIDLFLRR